MNIRSSKHLKVLRHSAGFTLLELLFGIAIIGILSAIATQEFNRYRSHSIDAQMRMDLKNAAVAMESYFSEYESYPTTVSGITAVGFRSTSGVALTIAITTPSTFTLTANKPAGTQASFTFDSSTGLVN